MAYRATFTPRFTDWSLMIQPLPTWILAAALAVIIVSAAVRLRALSPSGAVAATLLGTIVVGSGGWWPGIILVTFFATSSLLSKGENNQASGARRNWLQVLANGWGMLLGCVLYALTSWEPWLLFGIGAVAAATADTWSSELGPSSTSPPRLITTGKIVPPGTSGGVSLRGTLASVAGALVIALLAAIGWAAGSLFSEANWFIVLPGIFLGGIAGGLLDSLLGATVQEQRWCNTCEKTTEANPHHCGTPTHHIRGIAGFNNDVVNVLCVLTGALFGLVSGIL